MENSLLYTFSTIAQALGGAFALLSAFVLYRFQSLDGSMKKSSQELVSMWPTAAETESYLMLQGLSAWRLLTKVTEAQIARRKALEPQWALGYTQVVARERLIAGARQYMRLTCTFWPALGLTFLVMTVSVLVTRNAHDIVSTRTICYIHILTMLGVVAFAACLISYLAVIYAALVDREGDRVAKERAATLIIRDP